MYVCVYVGADDDEEVVRGGGGEEEERDGLLTSGQISIVHQQAWLMKVVAVEMRVTARTQQHFHNQRLVDLLLGQQSTNQIPGRGHMTGVSPELLLQYALGFSLPGEGRRKVSVLLDQVILEDPSFPPLDLQHFDQSALEKAILSCDRVVCMYMYLYT